MTVQYSIYNIGTRCVLIRIKSFHFKFHNEKPVSVVSTAQSVTLEDDTFPPDEFVNVQGLLTIKWDRVNTYPQLVWCAWCVIFKSGSPLDCT